MAIGPNIFNFPRCKEQVFLRAESDQANDNWIIHATCKCQTSVKTFDDREWRGLYGHVQEFWENFVEALPKEPPRRSATSKHGKQKPIKATTGD